MNHIHYFLNSVNYYFNTNLYGKKFIYDQLEKLSIKHDIWNRNIYIYTKRNLNILFKNIHKTQDSQGYNFEFSVYTIDIKKKYLYAYEV
jgi:hypothetical protein